MYSLLDDIAIFTRRAAAFVAGKGATTTAVAASSPFLDGASHLAPAVGMGVGLPITAAISTMNHHHRETAILNNFRNEIAASFGISPENATHDHLRTLAFGNERAGRKPQPFFREALERNDKNRWIDIGANLIGGISAIAFAAAKGVEVGAAALAGWKTVFANEAFMTVFETAKETGELGVGVLAVAATAGVISMAVNHIASNIGRELFQEKERSSLEKLETLARQKGKGVALEPEQVMDLVASVHPEVKQEISSRFNAPYSALSEQKKQDVLEQYDHAFSIREVTRMINAGEMKINELAFITAGQRSGVPAMAGADIPVEQAGKAEGVGRQFGKLRDELSQETQNQTLATQVLRGETEQAHDAGTYRNQHHDPMREDEQRTTMQDVTGNKPSFAERYAPQRGTPEQLSHVERLQQAEQEHGTTRTIH